MIRVRGFEADMVGGGERRRRGGGEEEAKVQKPMAGGCVMADNGCRVIMCQWLIFLYCGGYITV